MRIFAIIFGLAVLGAVTINVAVDPGHRWHRTIPLPQANWSDDECWVVPNQYEQRAFRRAHLSLVEPPEVVVMGSSRAQLIGGEMFRPGTSVYNASVNGATAWDFVAIWQYLKENGKIPRNLLIVGDTWLLNRNTFAKHRWIPNFPLAMRFLSTTAGAPWGIRAEAVRELVAGEFNEALEPLNVSVLKSSLLQLPELLRGPASVAEVTPIAARPASRKAVRRDGSLLLDASEAAPKDPSVLRQMAENTGKGGMYAYLTNWEFHDTAQALLGMLLADAERTGTKVMLLEPPFHPATLEILLRRSEYRAIPGQFSRAMAELKARHPSFQYCSALDSTVHGCGEAEFTDSSHVLPSCAAKVVRGCLLASAEWRALTAGAISPEGKRD